MQGFMRICPVGAEMFHAHRRTDRQTGTTKLIVAFRNYVNAPKNTLEEDNVQLTIWLNVVNKIENFKSCTSTTIHVVRFFLKNCYISLQAVFFVVCPRKTDPVDTVRIALYGDKFMVNNKYWEGHLACSVGELYFVSWSNLGYCFCYLDTVAIHPYMSMSLWTEIHLHATYAYCIHYA
jgi:hypothetical protein